MRPPAPRSIIRRATARETRNIPFTLVSKTASHSASIHLHDRGVRVDAGVVDQDVDLAEAIDDLLDRSLHRRGVAHVDLDRQRLGRRLLPDGDGDRLRGAG